MVYTYMKHLLKSATILTKSVNWQDFTLIIHGMNGALKFIADVPNVFSKTCLIFES